MKHEQENKGITLIALVITIIVMLILVAVVVSISLGDNGLFNKAKEAAQRTNAAVVSEVAMGNEVGSYIDSLVVEHPNNEIEVKSNSKNLWNDEEATYLSNYWTKVSEHKYITTKSAATAVYIYFDLVAGITYTGSAYFENIVNDTIKLQVRNPSNSVVATLGSGVTEDGRYSIEYTPTESGSFRFLFGANLTGSMEISNIQVEKDSLTEYEPYKTPTVTTIDISGHDPIRTLGSTSDYIDYDNSRIIRNIGKLVFTGNEDLVLNANNPDYLFVTYSLSNLRVVENLSDIQIRVISNYLEGVSSSLRVTPNAVSVITSKRFFISLFKTDFPTVESLKNWLAEQYKNGNPVILYYQLETPIPEAINN